MYKLFITDLDGTLLDDEKNISSENRLALEKLIQTGIPVTIFTGRNYHSAKRYFEELEIDIPVVLQNGAFIIEPVSEKIIHSSDLDSNIAKKIVSEGKKIGVECIIYSGFLELPDMFIEDGVYAENPFSKYVENNLFRLRMVEDLLTVLESRSSIAQLAFIGNTDKLFPFCESVKEQFPAETSSMITSVINGTGFLEVFGSEVSKGKALEKIAHLYNVTYDDIVFIGDNYNDVEIMKLVGMPVSTGNAPEDVKKLCKMVVSGNNEHGVSEAINKIWF